MKKTGIISLGTLIVGVLLSFPAAANGQPERLREQGRTYVKWFYSGDTDRLWEQCSPECQQQYFGGDKKKLLQSQKEFVKKYGTETELLWDQIVPATNPADFLYTHSANYTKSKYPVLIWLEVDRVGSIASFGYLAGQAPGSSSAHIARDMNPSPLVICLVIGLTMLLVCLLILCVVYVLRARARRKAARWPDIMGAFGLRPTSLTERSNLLQSMAGVFRGRNIEAAVGWYDRENVTLNLIGDLLQGVAGRASVQRSTRRTYYTNCRTFFDPPLLVGLRVECETRTGALVHRLFKKPGVTTGSPSFDKAFSVQATDPSQARNLLTSRLEGAYCIADLLVAARRIRGKPSINDTLVNIEFDGIVVDANLLEQALSMVVALAGGLQSARRCIPPAQWEQSLADGWGRFAQPHGMTVCIERGEMTGNYAGQRVRVSLSISDGAWHTRFAVRLGTLPVTGLRISPKGPLTNLTTKMFGVDIGDVVGDPAFDGRFSVRGEPANVVRQILGPEVRRQLLLILSKTPSLGIESNELWISVNGMITQSFHLSAALDDATSVARSLVWANGVPAV